MNSKIGYLLRFFSLLFIISVVTISCESTEDDGTDIYNGEEDEDEDEGNGSDGDEDEDDGGNTTTSFSLPAEATKYEFSDIEGVWAYAHSKGIDYTYYYKDTDWRADYYTFDANLHTTFSPNDGLMGENRYSRLVDNIIYDHSNSNGDPSIAHMIIYKIDETGMWGIYGSNYEDYYALFDMSEEDALAACRFERRIDVESCNSGDLDGSWRMLTSTDSGDTDYTVYEYEFNNLGYVQQRNYKKGQAASLWTYKYGYYSIDEDRTVKINFFNKGDVVNNIDQGIEDIDENETFYITEKEDHKYYVTYNYYMLDKISIFKMEEGKDKSDYTESEISNGALEFVDVTNLPD